MTVPTLSVQNVCVQFDADGRELTAVDDVSFTVDPGRVLGLVGESGSGKSVTALSIMRLIDSPGRITRGNILLNGHDILAVTEEEMRHIRGSRIAMIFQDPMMTLNPVLRIETQLIEGILAHRKMPWRDAWTHARDILGQVGVPSPDERMKAYPHQFSGGMRQRVVIAAAMLHEPDVIVADEATTALDVTTQSQILFEMQRLCSDRRTALIWITHDLSVVAGLAHEVAVMYAGRIVEMGPVDEIIDNSMHPYTRGLMESLPSRNQRGRPLRQIPGTAPSLANIPAGCAFRTRCGRATEICFQQPEVMEPRAGRSFRCHHPVN